MPGLLRHGREALSAPDLETIRERTVNVYDQHAIGWDRHRVRIFYEQAWLERLTARLPRGASVLDLGCGAGDPIAAWLIAQGFAVTGVDFAEGMLRIARARYPSARWLLQDMRVLDIDGPFDAIISWDGSFHLTTDEQRALLPRLASLLAPGGRLLLTVGPHEGEVTGVVEGEQVYHASLAPDEYRDRLEALGLDADITTNDQTVEDRTILFAVKRSRRSRARSTQQPRR
ncbi:class I SAM-dependent DNA methyltransferase [Parvularcula lutaonensis]|uniref:Class I SAM-dependent DNA methyltransferase n=1 Tax=Parvularcula lutaonensis TaxID=491923 RepID=A0ABV7M935_9PROT|nr:class I SAM-dependent methyltransferase [Parvularcula lutaonensis]GGY44339.1 hypothetical protein GCM10007148_11540 [Parvularcula lutaonensis]